MDARPRVSFPHVYWFCVSLQGTAGTQTEEQSCAAGAAAAQCHLSLALQMHTHPAHKSRQAAMSRAGIPLTGPIAGEARCFPSECAAFVETNRS